jgi:hypothetical protein
MEYEPRSATRFRVAVLIAVALPLVGIGIVLRIDQPFREKPVTIPEPATPIAPPIVLKLWPQKVIAIAVEYVKKHHGWTGVADHADRESFTWYVLVRRPDRSADYRSIVVDDQTGEAWDNH